MLLSILWLYCNWRHGGAEGSVVASQLPGSSVSACPPLVHMGSLWFPAPQKRTMKWIVYDKLTLAVNECMNVSVCAWCPAMTLCLIQFTFPHHDLRIVSGYTTTLISG